MQRKTQAVRVGVVEEHRSGTDTLKTSEGETGGGRETKKKRGLREEKNKNSIEKEGRKRNRPALLLKISICLSSRSLSLSLPL
jgi:hypothetical protein